MILVGIQRICEVLMILAAGLSGSVLIGLVPVIFEKKEVK